MEACRQCRSLAVAAGSRSAVEARTGEETKAEETAPLVVAEMPIQAVAAVAGTPMPGLAAVASSQVLELGQRRAPTKAEANRRASPGLRP